MIDTKNHQNYVARLMGLVACGLLSIWALPETIAFRHVLLGLGFFLGLFFLWLDSIHLRTNHSWPLWMLLGLYGWLILHLIIFSVQPTIQYHELVSIWVRTLLSLPLGLALGIFLSTTNNSNTKFLHVEVSALLLLGFSSTFVIFMGGYVYRSYLAQEWLPMQAAAWWSLPYREKPPFVVATALTLPLCCVLLLRVFQGVERAWWAAIALTATGLCVASNYLTNTKNGMAIVAVTIGAFAALSAIHLIVKLAKKSLTKTLVSLTLIASLLIGVTWGVKLHLEKNPAWSQLIANAKVGIDIDHQQYWKNRNIYATHPINDNGIPVDISTYERTAWFTAGLRLLTDRPQGFGLVHHSFGWMALEKWSDFYQPIGTLRGMTHSGWMDLALGIGIPGLLLILIPLAASWCRSLRMESLWGAYTSWAVPIFTLTYLTTEVTGAHHFIELLMFMTAFFIGITMNASPNLSRKLGQPTGSSCP